MEAGVDDDVPGHRADRGFPPGGVARRIVDRFPCPAGGCAPWDDRARASWRSSDAGLGLTGGAGHRILPPTRQEGSHEGSGHRFDGPGPSAAPIRWHVPATKRIPADVNLAVAKAVAASDQYISAYNIWMHHLVDAEETLFPAKMRLLSHWNLRDELKADYGDKKNGLARQRMIQQVMERIVTQTIPAAVIDNPERRLESVHERGEAGGGQGFRERGAAGRRSTNAREPDTRYAMLLGTISSPSKLVDPYSPTAPTLIARRFDEDREIPEARVQEMLVQIVSSPLVPKVAKLIEKRLGRPLEPFDIWYNGFRRAERRTRQGELDEIVAQEVSDRRTRSRRTFRTFS